MKLAHAKKRSSAHLSAGQIAGRICISFFTVLAIVLIFCYIFLLIICRGPSEMARDLFVNTCMETSFARLFPPLVLSGEQIQAIQQANVALPQEEVTDSDKDFTEKPVQDTVAQPDIVIEDVIGSTFKGKMMIVRDPSRIVVGTPPVLGADGDGQKLDGMISAANAIAGINGGGFADDNGVGNGATPLGIVIQGGELVYGSPGTVSVVIGFDNKNVFRVGKMSAQAALDEGIRDAVSFSPVLIVNGKPTEFLGTGGGLNPRTAIGQREDGSVLLLVIDGRQPHSIGATYKDLVDVMLQYGAVNAGNLDGGSSSMMYYQGELLNSCSSLYGPRKIASAFLVR